MVISTDEYWFAQLDEEAGGRGDQRSFHIFADGCAAASSCYVRPSTLHRMHLFGYWLLRQLVAHAEGST